MQRKTIDLYLLFSNILNFLIFVVAIIQRQMRDIQMVDLKAQYEKLGTEIDSAIKSVLNSTAFIKGSGSRIF